MRVLQCALLALLCLTGVFAAAGDATFSGVERIVAIGDVHGDYAGLRELLTDAQLIDRRGRWIGGHTHLVQLGDLPDRGADTRKAMDLLMKLEKQARRAGGRVHALIGNHEAMNMIGDLRYVHPGEYAAFAERGSRRAQQRYFEQTVDFIKSTLPEERWPVFDDAYKSAWEARHPLGYVEHRRAWLPDGRYGNWVREHNAIVRINDTLFMHGGLSPTFASRTIDEINDAVRAELAAPQALPPTAVIEAVDGPLWYRALATDDVGSEEARQRVQETLDAQAAKRIVVAHTPIAGAVIPRFDSRVITVDVGLADYYGDRRACLIIEGEALFALHRGHKLPLPASDEDVTQYLRRAAALDPAPSPLLQVIEQREAPPDSVPEPALSD